MSKEPTGFESNPDNTGAPFEGVDSSENEKIALRVKRLFENGLYEEIEELKSYPELIEFPEVKEAVSEELVRLKTREDQFSFKGILELSRIFKLDQEKVRATLIEKIESSVLYDFDLDLDKRNERINPSVQSHLEENDGDYGYRDYHEEDNAYNEHQKRKNDLVRVKYEYIKSILNFLATVDEGVLPLKDKERLSEMLFSALLSKTDNPFRKQEKEKELLDQALSCFENLQKRVHDPDMQQTLRGILENRDLDQDLVSYFFDLIDDKEILKNPEFGKVALFRTISAGLSGGSYYIEKNREKFSTELLKITQISGLSADDIRKAAKNELLLALNGQGIALHRYAGSSRRWGGYGYGESRETIRGLCKLFEMTIDEQVGIYSNYLENSEEDELEKNIKFVINCGSYDSSGVISAQAIRNSLKAQQIVREALTRQLWSNQEVSNHRGHREDKFYNYFRVFDANALTLLNWNQETKNLLFPFITKFIQAEDFDTVKKIFELIQIPSSDYQSIITPELLTTINNKLRENIFRGETLFMLKGLSAWNIKLEQIVRDNVKEYIMGNGFSSGYVDQIKKLLTLLPEDQIKPLGMEVYKNLVARNSKSEHIRLVRNMFTITEYDLKDFEAEGGVELVKQKDYVTHLQQGNFKRAEELKKISDFKEDFLESEAINTAIDEGINISLSRGFNIETIQFIMREFPGKITMQTLLEKIPAMNEFVSGMRQLAPEVVGKYFTDLHRFIQFYQSMNESGMNINQLFEIAREYPFLMKALASNEQFSFKLLFKFGSLDKLSKANIKELYENKEKVLAGRPDIDPNSRDFRIAMQDYLTPYRRNEEILSSMRKFGIDVEEWMNHESEIFFELGESSNVTLSEQIQPSVDRISESVDKSNEVFRQVVDEYQKELMEAKVTSVDEDELTTQLEQMKLEQERAKQIGDEKKIQGIARGIKNIEEQIANPKLVSAWTKFTGELSRLSLVKNDLLKLNEELKAKEEEQNSFDEKEINPRDRRKEQQKIKGQIEKIKKEIAEKNSLLAQRFIGGPEKVARILNKVLGENRTESMIQEVITNRGEITDHLTTDLDLIRSTINPKKVNDLDNTSMRIGIWDRNPDIDLYMGNYTDCCIRIDSDHMGEESTIADYLTDLGMQVIAIYDENKQIPVVAAWCWVGHDDDDNRALVIDNVESDKNYVKYKKQLEAKLKEYIESYAHKSKIGKIVQGKKNNDLVVAKMDSSYYKLGGYNRASGYFLEAESGD